MNQWQLRENIEILIQYLGFEYCTVSVKIPQKGCNILGMPFCKAQCYLYVYFPNITSIIVIELIRLKAYRFCIVISVFNRKYSVACNSAIMNKC